ncbi:MAG TPA: YoaK family protein [Rhodanobacteraceae bacterium]
MPLLRQFPLWAWIGAAVLAVVAGMVNVVGYLGFEHQAITHLTGLTTLLGAALAQHDAHAIGDLVIVIGAFLAGAILSGAIIGDSTLRFGRRYGIVLMIESALLIATVPLFERRQIVAAAIAAMACGLQNAMTASYSGTLVRTSHLTGMFTDLGIFLGHRLRGTAADHRRFSLCILIICGFMFGGTIGTLLFERLAYRALYVPAALTGLAGIAYIGYRLWAGSGEAKTA